MPIKKKSFNSNKSVQKIARKTVKQELARELETKNWFARLNPSNVTWSGTAFNLLYNPASVTYLTQGTDRSQFIGDTIDPVGIRINYQVSAALPAGGFYNIRVMLLQVKGGGTPAPTNVLQSVSNFMTPFAFVDPTYGDTFKVLYSKIHSINQVATNSINGSILVPSKRLRKINFSANSASSITNNGIWLLVYSDTASTATNFAYQSMVSYKDA